jgi:hypothetical protein
MLLADSSSQHEPSANSISIPPEKWDYRKLEIRRLTSNGHIMGWSAAGTV